jgi:hypothetical protein
MGLIQDSILYPTGNPVAFPRVGYIKSGTFLSNDSEASMKLLSRSLCILLLLYGVVFTIADALLVSGGAPLWSLIIFPVAIAGIQFAFIYGLQ